MTGRPSFLNTKSQRKTADRVTIDSLELHYKDILRGMFKWEGLPDDVPQGFIDADALYTAPGVAVKDVKGMGLCVLPCRAVTLDVYGRPRTWLAEPYGWSVDSKDGTGADLFTVSDEPVLYMVGSYRDRILPYLQILTRAIQTLGTNISALAHPVLISGMAAGTPGDNIGSIMLKGELEDGASYIPVVRPDALGMDVLDLGVTDNTQNLASLVDWADARILEIIGASTGNEKSSGVTALETVTGTGGMATQSDVALDMRKDWADKVNERFGLSVTVERNKALTDIIEGVSDVQVDKGVEDSQQGGTVTGDRRHRCRRGRLYLGRGSTGRTQEVEMIPNTEPQCPYMSGPCPKIEDVKEDVDDLKTTLKEVHRILYVIVGILTVNLGVTIL